jgi:hypothetical protein
MIRFAPRIATLAIIATLTVPAWAEAQSAPAAATVKTTSSPAPTTAGKTASTPASNFQGLSPGNQKIARALFEAQQPTANGPAPLNLNQIAALKDSTGWGKAFKQMKSEGLVSEKSLGQVVSHFEHATELSSTNGKGGGKPVVMTTGSGRNVTVGSGNPAPGDGPARGHDAASAHDAAGGKVTAQGGSSLASASGALPSTVVSAPAHIVGGPHAQ